VQEKADATLLPHPFTHHLLEDWSTLFGGCGSLLVPGLDVELMPICILTD
jgi:hypothetical protein